MEGDGDFAEMDPEELQGENEGNDDDVALNPEDILEVYEVEDGEIVGGGDEMADGENEDGDDGEDDGEWEDVDGEIVDRGDNSAVQFTGHEQGKTVFSVDVFGQTAVTGGEDDCAQVWRITDGQVLFKCTGHSDSVTRVQFNHDGQYVATASMDGVINVWNVSDGQLAVHLDCGDDLEWIDWHPRANFLIAGTASGSVYMWDVPAANMSFFSGHSASVMCGKWSIDGRTFITGSQDGNAIIWSPKNQTAIMKLDSKSNHMFNLDGITCIACHPDSIIAAFGGAEGAVKIVQTKTGKVVATLEGHSGGVEDLAFSNSIPSMLASSSLDGTVRIYDSTSTLLLSTCKHDGSVVRLRWHPKEAILITASLDGTARVWDARTGDCIKICSGHNNHVLDVAISNDGQTVVSCGEDSRALVFTDAATRS